MKRIAVCFVSAIVLIFGLAACGGGDEEKQEAENEPQESTQQQTTQQEPSQAATPSSTQNNGDPAAQLIGTWEATSVQDNPVPPGAQTITFFDDGTARVVNSAGSSETDITLQYSVLDDSRIAITIPDVGQAEATYSVNGDPLDLVLNGVPATYQRTG